MKKLIRKIERRTRGQDTAPAPATSGNDVLYAGAGNDLAFGGYGSDILATGFSNERMRWRAWAANDSAWRAAA